MSEEIRKMGIVEEILESILGTSEKEIFGYETDSIIMLNKKIILEHEIKLKLFDLEKELKNERLEEESVYKLIKKIIYETFGKGDFFQILSIRRVNEERKLL